MRASLAAMVLAFGLGGVFGPVGAAQADEHPVVVELYTSQGCSSCPPADALLADLARRGDLVALSLHVDYWDYIGWTDSFGDARFTRRQKLYARAAGERTIYTPQIVVGGAVHIVGNRPMDVADAVAAYKAQAPRAHVALTRRGGAVEAVLTPLGELPGKMVVQMVRFIPEATVDIRRGENAGRRITYANVVTNWQPVGEWDGRGEMRLSLEAPGDDRVAIIVQRAGMGSVVAAAALK